MMIVDDTGRTFRSKMEASQVSDVAHRRFYISELLHQDIEITDDIRFMRRQFSRPPNETLIMLIHKLMLHVELSEYGNKHEIRGFDSHENTVLTDDEANLLLDLMAQYR